MFTIRGDDARRSCRLKFFGQSGDDPDGLDADADVLTDKPDDVLRVVG
jgi:hypothetical protein